MVKAIALFSGGLDSILAVEIVRRQNIEVSGLSFETPFLLQKRLQPPPVRSTCSCWWKISLRIIS